MATTPKGLRFPTLADAPNGPLQIQQLAEDVDDKLLSDTGWVVVAAPAGFTGDTVYRKIGPLVTVSVRLTKTGVANLSNFDLALVTLPAMARPSASQRAAAFVSGNPPTVARFEVSSGGLAQLFELNTPLNALVWASLSYPVAV